MGFRCGIVGLPNVGKSTLFNALTETPAAQAANYPFCTIEPNVGQVAVPDARLEQLARDRQVSARDRDLSSSSSTSPASCAAPSKGEGLGNQFLANIREVDAIVHVLRCFEDGDVTHVEGGRPDRRCRNGRDRADARRPRSLEKRVADRVKKAQRRRQGSEARGRGARPGARPAARRQAARG